MLSFVYTYYDNPNMLAHQYALWSSYPAMLRRELEFIVVDDASPRFPAIDVPRPINIDLRIYRVLKDVPWHQDGARNLGADQAKGSWLFLCDIDHTMPTESLRRLFPLDQQFAPLEFITFGRREPDGRLTVYKGTNKPKPGLNIYLMKRNFYWAVGGYDESFCGYYGTDNMFRKRLLKKGKLVHRPDIEIIRYGREYIADASTTTLERKGLKNEAVLRRLQHQRRSNKITTLNFEWKQQL